MLHVKGRDNVMKERLRKPLKINVLNNQDLDHLDDQLADELGEQLHQDMYTRLYRCELTKCMMGRDI